MIVCLIYNYNNKLIIIIMNILVYYMIIFIIHTNDILHKQKLLAMNHKVLECIL